MAMVDDYLCPKCGSRTYETGQIRVSGGFWSSFFDVGNRRYNSVPALSVGTPSFINELFQGSKRSLISSVEAERSLIPVSFGSEIR